MAITIRNIKKWYHMIKGDSILHVNQGIGKVYSISEIKGYYNDMTEKVTKDIDNNDVPLTLSEINGELYHFPIAIFQYGLGAYDLYLANNDSKMLEKVRKCADWAKEQQSEDGSWEMYELQPGMKACSAMAQGEGASLLIRASIAFDNESYMATAVKAIDFMLTPLEQGGPTVYSDDKVYLLEYADTPVILNGMIFALWGLFDYIKVKDLDNYEYYKATYDKCVQTLIQLLPEFDVNHWSMYDKNRIASPFYHKLHIAQLKAMYDITRQSEFMNYANRFESYLNNKLYYNKAFLKKALQKVVE